MTSHRTSTEVLLRRSLTLSALVFLAMAWVGCGLLSGDNETGPGVEDENPAWTDMAEVHTAVGEVATGVDGFAGAILGTGGLVEQAIAMQRLDLGTAAGLEQYHRLSEQMADTLEVATARMADAALASLDLAEKDRAIRRMREEALAPDMLFQTVEAQPKLIGLGTVFVATAAAITVHRTFRAIDEAVNGSQRVVGGAAQANDASREAVARQLRQHGVSVPPNATGDQLVELFNRQSRDVRRRVTNDMRDWLSQSTMDNAPHSMDSTDLLVQDRQNQVQAARELGEVAVNAVVSGSQAVTGGVGDMIGGTAGAATDLVLTVTETGPMDMVNRHVDAVVVSRERDRVEIPAPRMSAEEARQELRAAAAGEPQARPDRLHDAAETLMSEIAGMAGLPPGAVDVPQRLTTTSTRMEQAGPPAFDGSVPHRGTAPVPNFSEGEQVQVLVTRPEITPQEVDAQVLGPATPLVLDTPPLRGTLTVSAAPTGPERIDGSRPWEVSATLNRVHRPVQIVFHGLNAVASPRVQSISAPGTLTASVEAYENATIRVQRLDSGEAWLLRLRSGDAPDDPSDALCGDVGTFTCANGEVICANLVCNGRADCSDGSDNLPELCGDPTHCCVATNGCPGETATSCADTCCCCPYGMICDQQNHANGCVRAPGY